ncbi:MAG: phage holin family protein [Kineosporiaceae bacterium]
MSQDTAGAAGRSVPAGPDHRSIQQLVADAVADAKVLAEQQRSLAQAELKQSAVRAGVVAGLVGTALTLLFFAGFALVITIAEAFVGAGLPRWGAYLLTVGIYVVVAVVLALVGVLVGRRIGPPRTAMTLARETVAEVRVRLQHLGRPQPAGPAQPTAQPPTSTGAASSAPSGSSAASAS